MNRTISFSRIKVQCKYLYVQSDLCILWAPGPFKHQDDVKGEEDMAAKKAALLEKRLRREQEAQEKKQQQELDQEQKREAAGSGLLSVLFPMLTRSPCL